MPVLSINKTVCVVAVLVSCFCIQHAKAQSLKAELVSLTANHPQIRAQRSALESAREKVDKAYSGYLPKLDVSGNVGPTDIQTDARDQAGLGAFNEVQKVARLTLSQNVFDGFETPARVRIARLNASVAEHTLEGTTQEVLIAGISAYVDILRQQRLVELARISENSIKTQAKLEDERVVRGGGITVDVLQAKSRLQIAKERRVAFEGALQDAISRYIQVFNHAPDLKQISDPTPPEHLLPQNLEDAVSTASHENPAVISSQATVEVAAERRRLARADYYPSFEVVGAANYEKDYDLQLGARRDFSVLLQATWNIFNGFATSSGVKQAAYDYRASQDNHEYVSRGVVEATRLAWQQLRTARDREELLSNAVVIAEEVFEARRGLREAGKETVINVLIAEDEVNNARINLTIARYDAITAIYQVLQAMGKLNVDTLKLRGS
ncbi:MAG: TolC family outer membrane protein [Rhodospirillales bacterium]|nr:TolC family outer membrane protein [Rhodospirillales bacterium]